MVSGNQAHVDTQLNIKMNARICKVSPVGWMRWNIIERRAIPCPSQKTYANMTMTFCFSAPYLLVSASNCLYLYQNHICRANLRF